MKHFLATLSIRTKFMLIVAILNVGMSMLMATTDLMENTGCQWLLLWLWLLFLGSFIASAVM